ncbi:hypothetical protein [Photobacterium leiognathi]|uniref:hypothetical protein n=1 Tax=Photobacterium leiognathi TaxID=553611 RepID=UPI000769E280|nr:hypothetical protein [Photobacterium leiognathi]
MGFFQPLLDILNFFFKDKYESVQKSKQFEVYFYNELNDLKDIMKENVEIIHETYFLSRKIELIETFIDDIKYIIPSHYQSGFERNFDKEHYIDLTRDQRRALRSIDIFLKDYNENVIKIRGRDIQDISSREIGRCLHDACGLYLLANNCYEQKERYRHVNKKPQDIRSDVFTALKLQQITKRNIFSYELRR